MQRVTRDLDVLVTRLSAYFALTRQLADRGHLAAVRAQIRDLERLLPDLEALVGMVYAQHNPHGFDEDLAPVVDYAHVQRPSPAIPKPRRGRTKATSP